MKKTISATSVSTCLLVLGLARLVHAAGEPTVDSVAVSPSSSVSQDTEVTVTVKATPADPDDVLAYILWGTNGTFSEWGPLYPESTQAYFPPIRVAGPGLVRLSGAQGDEWHDADGVLTFRADAVPGKYEIGCGVTVVGGPNKGAYSRTTFNLTVTSLVATKAVAVKKIGDPRFDFDIVIGKDAIPSEVYAAREFRNFFARASGVNLPIVTQVDRPDRHIFIGPSEPFRSSNVDFSMEKMGDEDLRIVIRGGNVAIGGGRPRGTLYGVYTFLEDYLGVRFLTPDHTHVPQLRLWPIEGPIDRSYHPPLEFRWSFYAETNLNPAFAARVRCNTVSKHAKFGGITGRSLINHTFAFQMPTKTYGKEHPEYFALVDGKRLAPVPDNNDDTYTQPCLTNPDVLRIVTEAVLAEIKKSPERTNISVSQNDNGNYCRCPKCAVIDEREGTPMGSLLIFVNAVADKVAKKYPRVKIGTLAYQYSRKPPKTIKARPNVQIQLCSNECSVTRPINDPTCKLNVSFCKDLTQWGRICDDISIWYYNVNFGYGYLMPMPTMRVIGPNIRFFAANNTRGVFMQGAHTTLGGEFSDLRNYVTSQLLWNPNLSGQALIDEFLELHYGKAAPPIRRFVNLLHDNAHAKGIGADRNYNGSARDWGLNESMVNAARKAFAQARRLADDDAVRARVEKASICAYRLNIDDAFMWGEEQSPLWYRQGPWWEAPPLPPATARRLRPDVRRFLELCDKYGVTNLSEGRTLEAHGDFPGWRCVFRKRLDLKEGESF